MPDHDERAPAGKLASGPAAPVSAPGSLRWVAELINTRSAQFGTDKIATPALLAGWLQDRYLLRAGVPVTIDEHHRTVRLREGLRALAALNNTRPAEADRRARERPATAWSRRIRAS